MIGIGFGSNLAFCGQSSEAIVQRAMQAVGDMGTRAVASSLYQSQAWPDPSDPPYVNAVMALGESPVSAVRFLQMLHAIEAAFGRDRAYENDPSLRYAPRTLDLDLLLFKNEIRGDANSPPIVPHPAIESREFVLVPLVEVAPDWRHPILGKSVQEMLADFRKKSPKSTVSRLQ